MVMGKLGSDLGLKEVGRLQSPSSINTYRQCPRKYYFQYIEELSTKPSIHLIKGSVVHSVLEDFFDQDNLGADFKRVLRLRAAMLLKQHWESSKDELDSLGLDDLGTHFDDAAIMVSNWLESFFKRMEGLSAQGMSVAEAFKTLTPVRETEYRSEGCGVRGFIDAIESVDGRIRLIDYKTSKSNHISDQYHLQLSIYALLYKEKHGELPHEVALCFLRHGEKSIEATERMVDYAKKEIKQVHESTVSRSKDDYPLKPGPLCKWSTGQCDFYEHCFCR